LAIERTELNNVLLAVKALVSPSTELLSAQSLDIITLLTHAMGSYYKPRTKKLEALEI
jgi:hypothetical protein